MVGGKTRGKDSIFCFSIDGVRLCHLGDLGQILDEKQIAEIGKVDILFTPAGGYFTLEPADVTKMIEKINPRVVIPMHYQTEKTSLPFSGVDEFLKGKQNVKKLNTSEIEFTTATLPVKTEIVVLKPSL